jgi:hypothetical protein
VAIGGRDAIAVYRASTPAACIAQESDNMLSLTSDESPL